MDKTATAPERGTNWLKIVGIITLIGVLVAVARIVVRVFRENPESDEGEHHEAA